MMDREDRQKTLYNTELNPETKLYWLIKGDEDRIKEHNPELWYAMLEWKDKNIYKIDLNNCPYAGGYGSYRNDF